MTDDDLFRRVDIQQVAAELHVYERAEREGRNNIPPSDTDTLSGSEKAIAHYFEQEAQEVAVKAKNKLISYTSRIEAQDIHAERTKLDTAVPELDKYLSRCILENEDQLPGLLAEKNHARAVLDDFRKQHHLARPASYPESRVFHIAVLLSFVVIESVLNTWFFALGSEFGLLGGLVDAFFASVLNNGLSVLIGFFAIRYIFHSNWRLKLIGFAGIALYLTCAPIVNLGIAHYRELMAVDPDNVQVETLARLWRSMNHLSPELHRIDSWILFSIGLAISFLALVDGYLMDDRYPGYGRIDRAFRRAEEAYLDAKQDLVLQLQQAREKVQAELATIQSSLEGKKSRIADYASFSKRIVENCRGYHRTLESACEALLSDYRGRNMEFRTTPAPACFGQPYRFRRLLLEVEMPFNDSEIRQKLSSIDAALSATAEVRRKANECYDNYRRRIENFIQELEQAG